MRVIRAILREKGRLSLSDRNLISEEMVHIDWLFDGYEQFCELNRFIYSASRKALRLRFM